MKTTIKKRITLAVFWAVLVSSFIFFAVLIHLKANGWKFNSKTRQFVQTGMISLNGQPDRAKVTLNGKLVSSTLPVKISELMPGFFDVAISSENYEDWQKTIEVLPGRASLNTNILLFYKEPKEAAVPADITAESIRESQKETAVSVLNSEIYFKENLVTRFSQNVLMATLYPDEKHIIFQLGSEVRIIDLDGSNDRKLFSLSNSEPTMFIFRGSGRTVFYLDQGKVLGYTIR